jgi:bisphosphoglycerate-dependent phosphoglycerate mutase
MEAQAAGKLLKAHGFAFDVVYTRCLPAMQSAALSCLYFLWMCALFANDFCGFTLFVKLQLSLPQLTLGSVLILILMLLSNI